MKKCSKKDVFLLLFYRRVALAHFSHYATSTCTIPCAIKNELKSWSIDFVVTHACAAPRPVFPFISVLFHKITHNLTVRRLCALLFASNSEFMFDVEKWQKRRNPKQ
jgi:hypothetical protein